MREIYRWFFEIIVSISGLIALTNLLEPAPTQPQIAIMAFSLALGLLLLEIHWQIRVTKKKTIDQESVIFQLKKRSDALVSILPKVTQLENEIPIYFQSILQDSIDTLASIQSGRITIQKYSQEHVWTSHIEQFRLVPSGLDFCATCVVPKEVEAIDLVFKNYTYVQYCRKSYDAVSKEHTQCMRKIFIVPKRSLLAADSLREHLFEFQRTSERLGKKDGINRMEAKVIVNEEYLIKYPGNPTPIDYMIWGNELMATSLLGDVFLLKGVELCTEQGEIERRLKEFNALYARGIELKPLLHDRNYQCLESYN